MKRTSISLSSLLILSALFTLTSCNKEEVSNGTQYRATMEGCTSQNGKTTLSGTALNWVGGDRIAVYGTAGCGIYSATPQTPATTAIFDNVSGETGDPTFRAFYPSTLTTDGMNITLPATQTYVENSIHEFPMYAESSSNTLSFKNLCGVLKLHLTKANTSISSIEVVTSSEVNGTFSVSYNGGVPELVYVSGGTNSETLTCSTPQDISEGADFYIALPATFDSVRSITLTTADGAVCTKKVKNTSQINVSRSQLTTVTLNADDLNFYFPGDWVDLGLPSGLLWATRNVGATSPEDYGDYFAWGETSTKSVYDWSTYLYCNGGNYNQLTKYCNQASFGYSGFTDNLTILQPGDDAATANYGGRTPTQEEWQELISNTTSQWTTQNGVNGRRFTGSNGNSLFLPAAGYRWGSSLYSVGGGGYYWSSSLSTDVPSSAWYFYFDSGTQYMSYYNRLYGRTVRAVRQN